MDINKFKIEINKELRGCIFLNGSNGYSILHNQFELFKIHNYTPSEINKLFEVKLRKLINLKNDNNIIEYFQNIPAKFKISTFRRLTCDNEWFGLTNKEYWETVRLLWNENSKQFDDRMNWWVIFGNKRGDKEYFMNETERKYFQGLPQKVKVYKGVVVEKTPNYGLITDFEDPKIKNLLRIARNRNYRLGISFTLSKKIGVKYFKKYKKFNEIVSDRLNYQESELYEGEIEKNTIFGYFNGRMEEEVILKPELIRGFRTYTSRF